METIIIIFGIILIIIGFMGSVLPVMPGLPFSYAALLILQLLDEPPFSIGFLVLWLAIVTGAMVLDNVIPAYGTKKYGGTKFGVAGSIIGMVIGIFVFPPLGMIIFPLIGAFVGEIITGNTQKQAIKSAWGSFIGFMTATGIKVVVAGIMAFYFFKALF